MGHTQLPWHRTNDSRATRLIIDKVSSRSSPGSAVGLGIVTHLILDLLMHGHDIVPWRELPTPKSGLGFVIPVLSGLRSRDERSRSSRKLLGPI